ncbi:MAG: hypothetical protein WA944_19435 [Mycobacterium sp.]
MRLWHMMRPDRIDAALRDGVILPTGYNDLARCEVKRVRGKRRPLGPDSNWCPHEHDRTPVTWFCTEPIAVRLCAGEVAWLFEVDTDAELWDQWAATRGADPAWIAERQKAEDYEFSKRARIQGGEWVTTDPIPREQWLSIKDLQLGALIPVSATRTA